MPTDGHSYEPADALLRVRALAKKYWSRGGVLGRRIPVGAANNVTFDIPVGKTLALVGGSGSGKSTVARCVARIERPDAGEIWINNRDIAKLRRSELVRFPSDVQMVFQDPTTSMNPRFSARETIEEPLLVRCRTSREERRTRVEGLFKEVRLSPELLDRSVRQFSGGQRQRIAIARALALRPRLLILDEAFTGLDLSTQAQIANLLLELQAAHSLSYLLISHDVRLVSRMADTIAVMSEGEIVEQGTAERVLTGPMHPKTCALVAAAQGLQATPS
jgi:peptide/nickel transport system ATP-binding protein